MELYRNENNNLHRDNGPAVVTRNLIQYAMRGRLHRKDGPAVITPNGTKQYYWKGVHIEPSLWERQDTITGIEILEIKNVELRRSLMEMIGFEEFIKRANPRVLDKDKRTGAVLYKVEMPKDDEAEPLVVVKVLDGTPLKNSNGEEYRKEYFLRVPANILTCREAIAWTFSMTPKEYNELEKET
jgi:hypothetical protein